MGTIGFLIVIFASSASYDSSYASNIHFYFNFTEAFFNHIDLSSVIIYNLIFLVKYELSQKYNIYLTYHLSVDYWCKYLPSVLPFNPVRGS